MSKKARQGVTKMRIRRGDRVRVIRGNHAGQEGTVLSVIPSENRVVIEGVNQRKKHARPSGKNPDGGIMTFDAPIHASNVMLIDPATGDPTRIRIAIDESRGTGEGKPSRNRQRISVKSGKPIPRATN